MEDATKQGKVEYSNPETGGKVWIFRDKDKVYIRLWDPKGGYIIMTELTRAGYDKITPVLMIILSLIGIALIVLRLIPV